MRRRIEIEIDSEDISDALALQLVQEVVSQGKLSNGLYKGKEKPCYTWVSLFRYNLNDYKVCVSNYTKNDCFLVERLKTMV